MKFKIEFGGAKSAKDIFDWNTVERPSADDIALWRSKTDATERQFPLAIALQVHDELESKMLDGGRLDALQLSEIRGGIKALSRFCQTYQASLSEDKSKPRRRDAR